MVSRSGSKVLGPRSTASQNRVQNKVTSPLSLSGSSEIAVVTRVMRIVKGRLCETSHTARTETKTMLHRRQRHLSDGESQPKTDSRASDFSFLVLAISVPPWSRRWASVGTEKLFVKVVRSEEHTSELQSHHDLVCRLLLEKK